MWSCVQSISDSGYPEGWGRVLELSVNKDRVGLGYHSQNLKKLVSNVVEGQVLQLPVIFTSVRHLADGQISVMEVEEDGVTEEEGLLYPKKEDQKLTNWTTIEIPEVTLFEK